MVVRVILDTEYFKNMELEIDRYDLMHIVKELKKPTCWGRNIKLPCDGVVNTGDILGIDSITWTKTT